MMDEKAGYSERSFMQRIIKITRTPLYRAKTTKLFKLKRNGSSSVARRRTLEETTIYIQEAAEKTDNLVFPERKSAFPAARIAVTLSLSRHKKIDLNLRPSIPAEQVSSLTFSSSIIVIYTHSLTKKLVIATSKAIQLRSKSCTHSVCIYRFNERKQ